MARTCRDEHRKHRVMRGRVCLALGFSLQCGNPRRLDLCVRCKLREHITCERGLLRELVFRDLRELRSKGDQGLRRVRVACEEREHPIATRTRFPQNASSPSARPSTYETRS